MQASVLAAITFTSAANSTDTTVLWIGAALMFLGVLCFGFLRLNKATGESRGFYDKTILIVLVATCSYIAMALGLGQFHTADGYRTYVPRYIDWVITTPLLLLDVILFAKPLFSKGWEWDAVAIVGFDVVMIVAGIVSGVVQSPDRWIWFWVSVGAYAVVGTYIAILFLRARRITDTLVAGKLRLLTGYLSAFWLVYPFVFALYFGGVLSGTQEDTAYAILDVGAKVGFGLVLLLGPAVELVERATARPVETKAERRALAAIGSRAS